MFNGSRSILRNFKHDLCTSAERSTVAKRAYSSNNAYPRVICPGCGSATTEVPTRPGYIVRSVNSAVPLLLQEKRRKEQEIYEATMASLDETTKETILPTETNSHIRLKDKDSRHKTPLCSRCHSLLHHSHIPANIEEDKASTFDVYSKIRQDPDALVINVVDVMDFPLSLLPLRKHIGTRPRIIHVFSRIDVLYIKPLTSQDVKPRLLRTLESLLGDDRPFDVRVISALKGWEVTSLANSLRMRRKDTNIYFVGSANAGKSSLVATLGRRSKAPQIQLPVVSHLPGTTLAAIPTEIELFGDLLGRGRAFVFDMPGVLKPGFSDFIKSTALQQSLPHKHIKAKPLGLKSGESLILSTLR